MNKIILGALLFSQILNPSHARDHHDGQRRGDHRRGPSFERRLELNFHGREYRGQNTLFLKREIMSQLGMHPQGLNLKSVILVAKSRMGHGKAQLSVGGFSERMIRGRTFDFDRNEDWTYDQVQFMVRGRDQMAPWQLQLQGQIRVKKVILIVDEDGRGRGFGQTFSIFMNNVEYRGQGKIFLKKEMMARYPQIDLRNKKLKRIILHAKSRFGYGRVFLRAGQHESYEQNIPGNPLTFNLDNPFSFGQIVLEGSSYDERGPWQLIFRGDIKVSKVDLVLE